LKSRGGRPLVVRDYAGCSFAAKAAPTATS
jgi:hypothetical protein